MNGIRKEVYRRITINDTLVTLVIGTVCFAADSTRQSKLNLATAAPGVIRYYGSKHRWRCNCKAHLSYRSSGDGLCHARKDSEQGTARVLRTSAFSATAIDNGDQTWTVEVVVVDTAGTAYSGTSKNGCDDAMLRDLHRVLREKLNADQ